VNKEKIELISQKFGLALFFYDKLIITIITENFNLRKYFELILNKGM